MIQQQTKLRVSDNSGAKTLKCIKVLGGYKKKYAFLGDFIIVSVKELRNKSKIVSKVKKGEVYKAIVLKTKTKSTNKDGSNIFFKTNAACLLNKNNKPLGTRILTPLSKKFKNKKFTKLVNIALGTV